MTHWVTPQEMSELDRSTIEGGIPGAVLMERAGTALADLAIGMLKGERLPIVVLAGPGNNGGDGYVAARLLHQRGHIVSVHPAFQDSKVCSPDCAANRASYLGSGGLECSAPSFRPALVIDALLGTGFAGRLKGQILSTVQAYKSPGCPILSADCPTGVNCLTGEVDTEAVRADVTVTFAAPKLGMLLPPGCGFAGAIFLADIGIHMPDNHLREVMDMAGARAKLPPAPLTLTKAHLERCWCSPDPSACLARPSWPRWVPFAAVPAL